MNENKVIRYVITHIKNHKLKTWDRSKHELRTLTFPQQGRHTFNSDEEAKRLLEVFKTNGLQNVLTKEEFETLEVRPCECWAGHHDPCGIYFD